jgi:hypothetical protein
MKSADDKPDPDEGTVQAKSPRAAEIWQIIEEYANDLREIIKKLRRRLN